MGWNLSLLRSSLYLLRHLFVDVNVINVGPSVLRYKHSHALKYVFANNNVSSIFLLVCRRITSVQEIEAEAIATLAAEIQARLAQRTEQL